MLRRSRVVKNPLIQYSITPIFLSKSPKLFLTQFYRTRIIRLASMELSERSLLWAIT